MARILIVGKGAPDRGGIAAHLAGLLASPLADEHELEFLNLAHTSADPAGGRLTAGNIARTLADLRAIWRASRGVDVVSIHSALEPAVTLLRAGSFAAAARLRGARSFVHAHGGALRFWLRGPVRRLLARFALVACERVVAVAEGERRVLADVLGEDHVVLVENGVDTRRFPGRPRRHDGPPRLLYAGLLTPRKGVLDLLDASSKLMERGLHHELVLAGGTPDEGRAAEEEVRAAAPPTARFLGAQPHERMPELYADADVFVLPSWWEAFPMSLLEAMSSGLPVVATDVGDVSRLVEDGVTGLLVSPRDPAALALALERLLNDPELRDRLGAAGTRRVAERYGVDRCARRLSELFEPAVVRAAAS